MPLMLLARSHPRLQFRKTFCSSPSPCKTYNACPLKPMLAAQSLSAASMFPWKEIFHFSSLQSPTLIFSLASSYITSHLRANKKDNVETPKGEFTVKKHWEFTTCPRAFYKVLTQHARILLCFWPYPTTWHAFPWTTSTLKRFTPIESGWGAWL